MPNYPHDVVRILMPNYPHDVERILEVKRIYKLQIHTEIFILPDNPAHDEALLKVSLHMH